MAGRLRKRGAAAGLVPSCAPATDLTATRRLTALSGERIIDIARRTLDAADRMVGAWEDLEPIVKALIGKVRTHAESPAVEEEKASVLLRDIATVASRVGNAATAVLRASEGQVRLAVLLEGPTPQRTAPTAMTEKQLVGVVIETARRIKAERGACPVCTVTVAVNGKQESRDGASSGPP